jgi:hypothetical protein
VAPCCFLLWLLGPLLAVATGRLAWEQWVFVERTRDPLALGGRQPRGGALLAATVLATLACAVATFATCADLFALVSAMLGRSRLDRDYPGLGFLTASAVVGLGLASLALQRLAIPRAARTSDDTLVWTAAAAFAFAILACHGALLQVARGPH